MSKIILVLARDPLEISCGFLSENNVSSDRYFLTRGFPATHEGHEEEKEFARRLVSSFNALKNFSIETLEPEETNNVFSNFVGSVSEFTNIKEQNAQLLDALRICREDINWMLNNREFLTGAKYDHIDRVIGEATTATAGEKIEAGDFVYISEEGKVLKANLTKNEDQ